MTALAEKRGELDARRAELAKLFEEHDGKTMPLEVRTEIKKRNDELTELGKEFDSLREMDEIYRATKAAVAANRTPETPMTQPGGQPEVKGEAQREGRPERPNIGKLFTATAEYKTHVGEEKPRYAVRLADVSVKTLMTTTAGFAPFSPRIDMVVEYAQRRPVVADLIPQDDVDAAAIIYMEETTNTNAAAPVAEGGTKQESALAFTQRTVPVEVIATWLPVTRQQMDDVQQIEAVINNRLTRMLQLAEETQLLTGNGTSPNLQGFYNKSGVQTQAKGTDSTPSAIFKAMTLVRFTGFADPTGVILHPNDWQDIRLLQDANGNYIWGSPADAGPERIWGLPVVVTPAATENTGFVGDFALFSHISRKQGITIESSDSHSTYFIENKIAIRAEERLALEIYRPAAFAKITGI